jgi:integrase
MSATDCGQALETIIISVLSRSALYRTILWRTMQNAVQYRTLSRTGTFEMKLTKRNIKTAAQTPGRHSVDGSKGLFLKVMGADRVFWTYRYRFAGKETEIKLVDWPAMSLDQAIALHAERYALLRKRTDPQSARRAAEAAVKAALSGPRKTTFGEAADAYVERMLKRDAWKNPKHRQQWRATLASLPAPFRALAIDDIGPREVFEALDPIWTRTPETGARLRSRIETLIGDDREPEDARPNPAALTGWLKKKLGSVKKLGKIDPSTGARIARGNHPPMPNKDIPDFMRRLRERSDVAARVLEFAILTAARSGEAMGATWGEIDFDEAMWTVPATRMKMGVEHRVPLSEHALAILRRQLELAGGDVDATALVFPSAMRRGARLGVMALKQVLDHMAIENATVHGFRATARSWMADAGIAFEVAEGCLSHKVGDKASQAYVRTEMIERRRVALAGWAQFCAGEGGAGAEIIPLARAS